MKYTTALRGIGQGEVPFLLRTRLAAPMPAYGCVLQVYATLTSKEVEAYKQRYRPELNSQFEEEWFSLVWLGESAGELEPQVCISISPEAAQSTQDTMEPEALAIRAVHELSGLLHETS